MNAVVGEEDEFSEIYRAIAGYKDPGGTLHGLTTEAV